MSTITDQKRRELLRQERLLIEATHLANRLSEERRLRLYDYLDRLIATGVASFTAEASVSNAPAASEVAQPSREKPKSTEGSYTERTEALLVGLGPKKGLTVREIAAVTGQAMGSVYGTLVYVAKSRKTIKKRGDGKWYAIMKAKHLAPGTKAGKEAKAA